MKIIRQIAEQQRQEIHLRVTISEQQMVTENFVVAKLITFDRI